MIQKPKLALQNKRWYYKTVQGTKEGPFGLSELQTLYKSKKIDSQTHLFEANHVGAVAKAFSLGFNGSLLDVDGALNWVSEGLDRVQVLNDRDLRRAFNQAQSALLVAQKKRSEESSEPKNLNQLLDEIMGVSESQTAKKEVKAPKQRPQLHGFQVELKREKKPAEQKSERTQTPPKAFISAGPPIEVSEQVSSEKNESKKVPLMNFSEVYQKELSSVCDFFVLLESQIRVAIRFAEMAGNREQAMSLSAMLSSVQTSGLAAVAMAQQKTPRSELLREAYEMGWSSSQMGMSEHEKESDFVSFLRRKIENKEKKEK